MLNNQVNFNSLSQEKYDNLISKDPGTFYRTETNLYLGEILLTSNVATADTLGIVKPDNESIQIDTEGQLHIVWGDIHSPLGVPELQSDNLVYNGAEQFALFTNYEPKVIEASNISAVNAGDYLATFTPKSGYNWIDGSADTVEVPWSIDKCMLNVPTVTSSLVKNGTLQSPTLSEYNPALINAEFTPAIDPGQYSITYSLTSAENSYWSDDTTADKSSTWLISNATGSINTSVRTLVLDNSKPSATIDITLPYRMGSYINGHVDVSSSDSSVATATAPYDAEFTNNSVTYQITINSKGKSGNAKIIFYTAATTDFSQAQTEIDVTCNFG